MTKRSWATRQFRAVPTSAYDPDSGVHYTPVVNTNGCVGLECEHDDGRVTYLYFNPSGGSDDGVASVFVYEGEAFDPCHDQPVLHYDLFVGEEVS